MGKYKPKKKLKKANIKKREFIKPKSSKKSNIAIIYLISKDEINLLEKKIGDNQYFDYDADRLYLYENNILEREENNNELKFIQINDKFYENIPLK